MEDFASPDLNIGASEVDIIVTSMLESDCCKLQGKILNNLILLAGSNNQFQNNDSRIFTIF